MNTFIGLLSFPAMLHRFIRRRPLGSVRNIVAFEMHNFHQRAPHPAANKTIVHASLKQTPG